VSLISIRDAEALVDSLVRKGVAYAVALYPFLYSSSDDRYINTVKTLEPAFGKDIAEKIYNELHKSFENINLWTKLIIEGKETFLRDYLQKYILRDEVARVIVNEIEKRVSSMPEEDRKILSVACAIIDMYREKSYPGISISYPSYRTRGINVSSTDYEYFSPLISSISGVKIDNIRTYFYRYLLGFEQSWSSRRHRYYELEIYPFAVSYVQRLALDVHKYIKIPDLFTIKSVLEDLYRKGELYKLALVEHSLSYPCGENLEQISQFTGLPREHLCNIKVEGVISNCFVNPFAYDYVKEVIEELYEKALNSLMAMFRAIFEKLGYSASCVAEYCTFTKSGARPIYIYFYPWIKTVYSYILAEASGAIKAVVMQGVPVEQFVNSDVVRDTSSRGYLWLFLDRDKIVVVTSSTYRRDDHYELLRLLKDHFILEVLGPAPKELEPLATPAKPVAIEIAKAPSKPVQAVERFGARDPLEDVVASALKSLGFSVKVDHRIVSRAGTEVEVDVWAEKAVGDMRFAVYASCKNWDRPVEVGVVREEFGRILQLPFIPHVRIIVAPLFTDSAKKEAYADGFVIVETGESVTEENLEKIYQKVYERLNKLFVGVAPKWMQELAEKARSIAEEIRKLSEELEKVAGIR
jgi:predicted RecB family endonuclease